MESNDGSTWPESAIKEERERIERNERLHDDFFVENITKKIETAQSNGLTVGAYFQSSGEELLTVRADEPEHAASINKLAIAAYVVDNYDEKQVFVWNQEDVLDGAGIFDESSSETRRRQADVSELLEDMLVRGGNTAMKVLVNGHAEDINRYLSELGFEQTRLQALGGNRFYTGTTSARESAILIQTLVGDSGGDTVEGGKLGRVTAMALRRSERSVVWKTLGKAVDDLELASKSGELPRIGKPEDADYNPYLQHETGIMYGVGEWLAYSVLMSSDKSRRYVAKQTIGQIGSEIANYLGIKKRLHVPTYAMAIALKAAAEKRIDR